jgi:hypothetical protein
MNSKDKLRQAWAAAGLTGEPHIQRRGDDPVMVVTAGASEIQFYEQFVNGATIDDLTPLLAEKFASVEKPVKKTKAD